MTYLCEKIALMATAIGHQISIVNKWKTVATLPDELKDLASAVEKSKYMLELGNNFDDAGSPAYSEDTWEKAVIFITNYACWLFDIFGKIIATPKIYHAPEGSVDLYWENERFNLLINIPAGGEPATFYGDNYGSQVIEGKFDPTMFQQALLPDLSIIST